MVFQKQAETLLRSNYISDQYLPRIHTAKCLEDVMTDTLTQDPEESFCFLNEKNLKTRAQELQSLFLPHYPYAIIAYAVKANCKSRILKILAESGITAFDCASPNEIMEVRKTDATCDIFYNHPIKREQDIHKAAKERVKHYTVQTQREVEKVLKNTKGLIPEHKLEFAVRMQTLNEDADINLSTKFGAIPKDVLAIIDYIRNQTAARFGISTNTGSQNRNPNTFADAVEQISEIIELAPDIDFVNLGGGLPVNYFENDKFKLTEFFEIINKSVKGVLKHLLTKGGRIIMEPGRAMIADAVDLVIPILSVEQRNGTSCAYINDGVFTSFSDYPLHRWHYNFKPISCSGKTFSTEHMPFTLFGRTCDSGDAIRNVSLPCNLNEGDYLWIPSAGAYLDSQTSHFNGFDPPTYIHYNI